MQLKIEICEKDLRKMVASHIQEKTGQSVDPDEVKIEVKSKQNWKSEWEESQFRAVYHHEE